MGYAFISYSSKNQSSADSMRALLDKNNIDTWMAPYDIPIGSKYAMVINRAVKDCSCFILLLTDHAQNSVWVAKEVERAINYRKPIIPIQLEDLVLNDEFELYISSDQIVALPKIDESEMMKKIIRSIIAYTGQSSKKQDFTPEPKQPKKSAPKKRLKSEPKRRADIDDSAQKSYFASAADSSATFDFSGYKLPSPELLEHYNYERDYEKINEYAKLGAENLIRVLEDFRIKAVLKAIDCGPRLIRYQIVPAKGVRVSQIERIADDIALALAAESVRIEAPIPGKSAVGIEIPSKYPETVSIRELITSAEFIDNPSKTGVCIGKSVDGTPVFSDIADMPHLLVGGAVGTGKSVCINSLVTSILYKARPDEVRFIMIDPKKIELSIYQDVPHLLVPVITDAKIAAGALIWAVEEMNRRYDLIIEQMAKNLDAYNDALRKNPKLGTPLPKIIIIIDELADLMVQMHNPIEHYIMLISQKARAAGIHLIVGTQRPSVKVITGPVKANIPSRISCKVARGADSRTILDQLGAQSLLSKGDMLVALSGKAPIRVQGTLVSEAETKRVVDFIKAHSNAAYDKNALLGIEAAIEQFYSAKEDAEQSDEDEESVSSDENVLHDPKFIEAVQIAISSGAVSISILQRKLKIGYSKAALFIDKMDNLGIVGEKNGSKPRKTLMSMEEWNKKLDSMTD